MTLTLLRKWSRDKYIIGELLIDGNKFCHTMEPPLYKSAHPAIPAGTYKVEMYPSGKFHGMRPILLNVPGRSGILIHEGNYPKDTQGCILVGKNLQVGTLSYSRNTLTDLMAKIKGVDEVQIIIQNKFC